MNVNYIAHFSNIVLSNAQEKLAALRSLLSAKIVLVALVVISALAASVCIYRRYRATEVPGAFEIPQIPETPRLFSLETLQTDGAEAMQSLEAYKEVSKRYQWPAAFVEWYSRSPRNAFLYHIRKEMCFHWSQARNLVMRGKSFDEPEVISHCNTAMELGACAYKLAVKYETAWAADLNGKSREENMIHQLEYSWIIVTTFTSFYLWLRGVPIYNEEGKRSNGIVDSPELNESFYAPDSPQNAWREQYNEAMRILHQEINVPEMLARDNRYNVDEDTRETFSSNNNSPSVRKLYESNPDYTEKYIANQLLSDT